MKVIGKLLPPLKTGRQSSKSDPGHLLPQSFDVSKQRGIILVWDAQPVTTTPTTTAITRYQGSTTAKNSKQTMRPTSSATPVDLAIQLHPSSCSMSRGRQGNFPGQQIRQSPTAPTRRVGNFGIMCFAAPPVKPSCKSTNCGKATVDAQ